MGPMLVSLPCRYQPYRSRDAGDEFLRSMVRRNSGSLPVRKYYFIHPKYKLNLARHLKQNAA